MDDFVADAYRQLGRVEEGLATVAEAVRLTETYANLWWAAEVYRLKGEMLLTAAGQSTTSRNAGRVTSAGASSQYPVSPPQTAAEEWLHKARGMARQQEAQALELRVVMSLSRLWYAQGKKIRAHRLLAQVYGWFTEEFDTTDLREAQALLAALV